MEFEKLKKEFKQSFDKVKPEEFIQEINNLGYEFENKEPQKKKRKRIVKPKLVFKWDERVD